MEIVQFEEKIVKQLDELFASLEGEGHLELDSKIILETAEPLKQDIQKLKAMLYDYFARLSWLERDVTKRVLPDYRNIKSCSNIYVKTEIIEIGKQEHVELVKKLFNEELDIGIQHFIPLLKRGKQIGAGIYKDNHDEHGVHYHFCVGKNRTQHVRTKLMFTNGFKDNEDQSHDAIFYGEHGRYIDYRFFDLSKDIKEAIKKENNKLLSKFKNSDWLRPLKKFSKFEI